MNCPICQTPLIISSGNYKYCSTQVNYYVGYDPHHYEWFNVRYYPYTDVAPHEEIMHTPPFYLHWKDGCLKVHQLKYTTDGVVHFVTTSPVILELESVPVEDLLKYYHRFHQLRAFV
jgi:hypothetical protein